MADLIDRVKLLQEVNRIGGRPWSEWETAGVRGVIYRQESVDAEPVRHGRYENERCSVCSSHIIEVEMNKKKGDSIIVFTPYCPCFGAKMDLKEEST